MYQIMLIKTFRWQKTASIAQSAAAKALLETKNDDLVAKTTKSLGLKVS